MRFLTRSQRAAQLKAQNEAESQRQAAALRASNIANAAKDKLTGLLQQLTAPDLTDAKEAAAIFKSLLAARKVYAEALADVKTARAAYDATRQGPNSFRDLSTAGSVGADAFLLR